jgi:hypothetical protein
VVAVDRDLLAVRGERERRDHRRGAVNRGLDLHEARVRGVVLGAFLDPPLDQRHLLGLERVALLGHLRLGAADHLEQDAVGGIARDDGSPVLAALHERLERRHVELALALLGAMAAVARGSEQRPDVLVVADRLVLRAGRCREGGNDEQAGA